MVVHKYKGEPDEEYNLLQVHFTLSYSTAHRASRRGCQNNINFVIFCLTKTPRATAGRRRQRMFVTVMVAALLLLFLGCFCYQDCFNVIFSSHPRPMRRCVSSCRQEWWQMKAELRVEWERNNNYSPGRYLRHIHPECKSGLRLNGLSRSWEMRVIFF
jgi:hypothetical protein